MKVRRDERKLGAFFSLTTGERRGLIVLFFLITLALLIPTAYKYYLAREHTALEVTISPLEVESDKKQKGFSSETGIASIGEKSPYDAKKEPTLFVFDPNDLPTEKWRALGFSDKQIRVIKNYEAKGGRFYTKEDVAKIYSISEKDFQRIAPFIHLSKQRQTIKQQPKYNDDPAKEPETILIDMNTTDTTGWKQLKGIGSVYAARIVKFRNALGGFHNKAQLQEVYGLSEETYAAIRDQVTVNGHAVKKLALNHISAEELSQHPYISRKHARIIVNYRTQHGAFQSMANLQEIIALNADFLRKIEPYLTFE